MAASISQSTTQYNSRSPAKPVQRPNTPPIPYFHSPFNHCVAPPAPLNFTGGPLVLTDSAISGGSPSFQRAAAEHPVGQSYKQTGNLRLTITKHRWKEVTDFLNDNIPVIEIRPYNKCDGKRYIYIRVDNTGPEPINLKARFRLRKSTTGEWLGYLTRSTIDICQDADLTHLSAFDVDITGNLTLLISEPILRRLDSENSGRNNNSPAEQELQIVVSTHIRGVYQEIAVLPFFRVKRKHKRPEKQSALEPNREPQQLPEAKKRPRTLSSEKHHPIPSLSGITASVDLGLAQNDELDCSRPLTKNTDLAAADSFLMLNDYEMKPAQPEHPPPSTTKIEAEDRDCEEIMNFIPPPSSYNFELL